MARVGGRSTWFAWFAGLVSAAALAALVWLALPMAPVVADWAGQALRGDLLPAQAQGGSAALPSPSATPDPAVADAPDPPTFPSRCEDLYPGGLWERLSSDWSLTLDEAATPPPSAVPALPEAFGAQILIGCSWQGDAGRAVLTVATVSDRAAGEAARILGASGFACAPDADGVRCERGAAEGVDAETHIVRGGLWLASIRSYPGPPTELSSTVIRVWP